jgi:hypothetical protein
MPTSPSQTGRPHTSPGYLSTQTDTQGNGATARVVKQKGGGYLVHITNQDGQTITVIRVKTKPEVVGLSERYEWTPPWTE